MNAWLEIGLSNALVAGLLAVAAWLVTWFVRRSDVAFFVWLVVMLKLVSPPIVNIPWELPDTGMNVGSVVDDERPATVTSVADPDDRVPIPPPNSLVLTTAPDPAGETAVPSSARPASRLPDTSLVASGLSANPPIGETTLIRSRLHDAIGLFDQLAPFIGWAWLTGSACWFLLAGVRIARFGRLLKHAKPAPPAWQAEVDGLARRLRLRRAPRLRLVDRAVPPLVWSMTGQATVLLPLGLAKTLSADQRTTLFVHELAHLERRAYLVSWLEMVSLGLYWWHPAAWWARRKIEQAEEHCCDARVVTLLPELARCYARTLLATVDFLSDARPAIPLGARGFSQTRHVKRRLEMILAVRKLERTGWIARAALGIFCLMALPLSIHIASAEPATLASISAALTGADAKSIEQRLDRLEKMVQALTTEVKAIRESQSAEAPPIVVKSIPETGATDVDPNLAEIKVTFNKDMKNGSWSWTRRSDDTFPGDGDGKIHYEKDKRTCVLPCTLEPGKTYWIGINSVRFKNFTDKGGHPATPYELTFTTKQ